MKGESIVLYHGRRRWTAPTDLAELIEPGPAGLDAYRPRLRYLLVDESAYADAELATMRNLAAALFRLENSRGPEDGGDIARRARCAPPQVVRDLAKVLEASKEVRSGIILDYDVEGRVVGIEVLHARQRNQ